MQEKNYDNTWQTIFHAASILFGLIGLGVTLIDNDYIKGIQFILTSGFIYWVYYNIKSDKIQPDYHNPMIMLGFIFSILGLLSPIGVPTIGLWIGGMYGFYKGVFKS